MKKKLLFLFITLLIIFIYQKRSFFIDGDACIINGTTTNIADSTMLYLVRLVDSKVIDSALVTKGNFNITRRLDYPDEYYIKLGNPVSISYSFILENKQMKLSVENDGSPFGTFVSTGFSVINLKMLMLFEANGEVRNIKKKLHRAYDEWGKAQSSSSLSTQLEKDRSLYRIDSFRRSLNGCWASIIRKNNNSLFSLFYLSKILDHIDPKEAKSLFENLDSTIKKHPRAVSLRREIFHSKLKIGDAVRPFDAIDNFDKGFNFDNIKGKYTILIFWASWCVPCRKEHPEINQIVKKYRDKVNFIGFSTDDQKDKWKNAIEADSLTWTQISDLKGRNSDVTIDYEVKFIPRTYVIDPNGNLIKVDVKLNELENLIKMLIADEKNK